MKFIKLPSIIKAYKETIGETSAALASGFLNKLQTENAEHSLTLFKAGLAALVLIKKDENLSNKFFEMMESNNFEIE